jgi:hypothetical protein
MKKTMYDIIKLQEKVKKAFKSSLGQQCDLLWTTSDGRIFIRHEEAYAHAKGQLDPDTEPLEDKAVLGWENEYNDFNDKQCYNALRDGILILEQDHPEFFEENTTGWDMMQTLYAIKGIYEHKQNTRNSEV